MTDNRELDKQIAEQLGWTVVHHKDTDTYALCNADNYLFVANALHAHKLYAHNKFVDLIPLGERKSEIEAWNDCPYYSTDMNAAIELLKLMPMGAVGLLEDGKTWFSSSFLDGAGILADEEADTPAMAICKAWLAYMQPKPATP